VLTERGRALYPAIEAIMRWGGEHLADEPCDCPQCARVRGGGALAVAR
jgi:DNA-binding HxlR family transcriptional regulator